MFNSKLTAQELAAETICEQFPWLCPDRDVPQQTQTTGGGGPGPGPGGGGQPVNPNNPTAGGGTPGIDPGDPPPPPPPPPSGDTPVLDWPEVPGDSDPDPGDPPPPPPPPPPGDTPNLDQPQVDCFVGDTLIQVLGGEKPIQDLQPGDRVMSWNHVHGCVEVDFVRSITKAASNNFLRIAYVGGEAVCTKRHPFYAVDKGIYQPGGLLEEGDLLWSNMGAYPEVSEVTAIENFNTDTPVYVYNISVLSNENFFAGGVLVHNKRPGIDHTTEGGGEDPMRPASFTIPEDGISYLARLHAAGQGHSQEAILSAHRAALERARNRGRGSRRNPTLHAAAQPDSPA